MKILKRNKKELLVRFVITLVVTFFYAATTLSQKKSIRFQHFTIEDGLPQNMVDCILEDSKGFMWFGTWNGLCRFDGYDFRIIQDEANINRNGFNNFIFSLTEDQHGNIWIGTEEGLLVYLNKKEKVKNITEYYKNKWPVVAGEIYFITALESGTIWVGGVKGMAEIRAVDDTARIEVIRQFKFGASANELSGTRVNSILKDKDSNLWVGTDQGINVLRTGSNSFDRILMQAEMNSIPNNFINSIYEDSKDNIWIGTDGGLSVYDRNSKVFTNYFYSPFFEQSLVHNSVKSIIEDANGNIIVGTLGGLSVYERQEPTVFTNYTYKQHSDYELNNDFVNCLYKDRKGNIWIGTERGGVNKYNSSSKKIEYFEKEINNKNSLNNNSVNSILEDERFIWIGTAGGGLNRYNKDTQNFTHYKNSATNPGSLPNDFVTVLCKDNNNELWAGAWGGGLNKLIPGSASATFKNFRNNVNDPNSLVSDFISSLLYESNGKLWIGTLGGLDVLDLKTEKIEHFDIEVEGSKISAVGCLTFDKNHNLWVGTRNGLYKIFAERNRHIDPKKAQVKKFKHIKDSPKSLSGNYVISLHCDVNGYLWAGTYGNGVNMLVSDKKSGTFKRITSNDGLPNNIVYAIVEDDNGDLWFTTDYGLCRYNPQKQKARNFYTKDGLQSNQYYWSAGYKNKEGKLYFGSMKGLNTFFPSWINEKEKAPNVVFTDLKIFNQSVEIGQEYDGRVILPQTISETEKIELSYKSKEFLFEFSALDYEKYNLIEYAYMLEGFDKNWDNIGAKRRFAKYTNLKPGNYTFKVRASYGRGGWTEKPASIKITIVPPFWQTLWFRLLVAAIIVFTIISYIRYREYSLKKQKKKLETQVKERTIEIEKKNEQLESQNKKLASSKELIEGQKKRLEKQNEEILTQRDNLISLNKKVELANQYKLKFFTNVSHEFRTPLTLILGPVERLVNDNNLNEAAKNSLKLINKNAKRLLNLVNQLMDFRKIEKGKMELKISRLQTTEFIYNITDAFKELSIQKSIDLKVDMKDVPDEIWVDGRKIENILYNLLSNAFKYTKEQGKVTVNVYLRNSEFCHKIIENINLRPIDNLLVIEVADTGKGIKPESLPHVFDRFYRADSPNNDVIGSGVGLALTKEIVEVHRGEIRVTSEYGKGSTFCICFPFKKECYKKNELLDENYNPGNIQEQVEDLYRNYVEQDRYKEIIGNKKLKRTSNRPTVLVVEDNEDLRDFIAIKLNESYNILEAENGKIAYDLALINDPALIISDIMMPEMNGIELCNAIKENIATSHIPVILLTAKSNVESRLEGFNSGADDYLSKPFNFSLLEARVKNLIQSRKKLLSGYASKTDVDPKDITSTKLDEQFLKKAISLVENNLNKPNFGVTELVSELNMSRSTLHRKFNALINQSTVDFINGVKLKKSIELLRKSELNISQIAYSVGFNDPKYYSRIFKKTFGKAPSEYQKNVSS